MRKLMEYKGFKAKVMEADRLVGDCVHGLPPGTPLDVYYSDEFVYWPDYWMKGSNVFLIPVKSNKGLWFDWRENSSTNTAIVPTIKGSNPFTGLQTSGFFLERYENKCPKHNKEFIANNFCSECGYKWPPQNYVTSPNILWLDGWLNPKDGTVRQFFFTEDMMRDVANHLIGKENTVPAFGFAFFSPVERRPENTFGSLISDGVIYTSSSGPICSGYLGLGTSTPIHKLHLEDDNFYESHNMYHCSTLESDIKMASYSADCMSIDNIVEPVSAEPVSFSEKKSYRGFSKRLVTSDSDNYDVDVRERAIKLPVKEVAVGAGAKIRQDLVQDTFPLDSWKTVPDATMTIYFVFQDKFEELKSKGMKDLSDIPEGMLSNCPVG